MHAHILYTPELRHLKALRDQLEGEIYVTTGETPPAITTVLISGRPTREQMYLAPHATALIIPFAGLDEATRELLLDFRYTRVYNLHHNAPMTAEMAISLLMSAAKRLVPADRVFRQHDWTPRHDPMPSLILDGKTAVILGYGAIGQRVGRVCEALGMRILPVRRSGGEGYYTPDQLPDLLPQAHVVMGCLPGTPETDGMIGAAELALLPEGAIVVNVGRANTFDEGALYDALKIGRLGCAGLDVWYRYPPDADSRKHYPPANYPFHELDNVVMSPHRAGGLGVDEVELRRMAALAEMLNALKRGDDVPAVDLKRGY